MVKKIGKYELGKTLGSGTFGKVKYAVDTDDPAKKAYAIKVLDRKQIEKENMQEQLKNEIAIMKMLKHDNVVKMFEVIQSPQHIYIVLEIVTGGELFDRIVAAKRFDETTARRYFQSLIFGVYYCHQCGVAHRDLKPENLLLDSADNLKISDFGLSAITASDGGAKSKLLMTTCGTPNYVAPEVLKEKGYNGFLTDIWSCGVILFVMLAGYLPFDDPTMNGLFIKIERGEYRMPRNFSEPVKKLIRAMLCVDPAKRITLDKILEDPWFTQGLEAGRLEKAKNANKQAPPSASDISNAVQQSDAKEVSTQGDGGQATSNVRSDFNAIELASKLIMGALSPMTSKNGQVTVRRDTQFVCNMAPDACLQRITDEVKKKNINVTPAKDGKGRAIKGFFNSSKGGLVQYSMLVHGTVCGDLSLVELQRLRGDTLEFQNFYRNLVRAMKDVVPRQPPDDDPEPSSDPVQEA